MKVFDAHCDVLSKLYMDPRQRFEDGTQLDASGQYLRAGNVRLQVFAIYLDEAIRDRSMLHILHFLDLYEEEVIKRAGVYPVRTKRDLRAVAAQEGLGGMLSIEGVDALQGDLSYLRTCYRLGVRAVGITWNWANWAADGVMESRGGGFTSKGKEMIALCNELGMVLDVSHLSERAFWELHAWSSRPFIASHSNVYDLCQHPRNLRRDQIEAIVERDGRMGLTFVPYFLKDGGKANMDDLLRHLAYICDMGGASHVGFGSDFDGIGEWVEGLENASGYAALADVLSKWYSDEQVAGFLWGNWYRFFEQALPDS